MLVKPSYYLGTDWVSKGFYDGKVVSRDRSYQFDKSMRTITLSSELGLGVDVNLSKRWSIRTTGSVEMDLLNAYNPKSTSITKHYYLAHITTGIKYAFGI